MPLSSSSAESEPAAYAHGKNGKLIVNGVVMCITKFEWERKQDKHDVTTTCSAGKKSFQAGLVEYSFSGEGMLDLTVSPYTEYATGSAVTVAYSVDGTTVSFISAKCVLDSLKFSAPVNDTIKFTFSGSAGDDVTVL